MGAVYYLRQVVEDAQRAWMADCSDGVTNYVELIEQIERWRAVAGERVAFVTFNYDTMLEAAVGAVIGRRFHDISDYVDNHPYSVFKLHGSIDWWTFVMGPGSSNMSYPSREGTVRLRPHLLSESEAELSWHIADGVGGRAVSQRTRTIVPTLSLPIVTKTDQEFACPPTHLAMLRATIAQARRVLIIGWRGAENHFYSLWKESFRRGDRPPERVLVVDTESGVTAIGANLNRSAHWLTNICYSTDGFSGCLGGDDLKAFLE